MVWGLPDAQARATQFLAGRGEIRSRPLGSGTDGIVYLTTRQSAVKVYATERLYLQELAAYVRLRSHDVDSICGHSIPRLIGHDDDLMR